jgi:hypothetical protein
VPWALDAALARSGTASLKSGPVDHSQSSVIRFQGFFSAGQLSFWARTDAGSCCNRFIVRVDGSQVINTLGNNSWNQHTVNLTLGVHEIEFRFERDYYGGTANDASRIDDLVFSGN